MTNTGQSFIKHLLTEGDRIAVGYLSPLSDQGGYAVAMNYGVLFFLCLALCTLPSFGHDPSSPRVLCPYNRSVPIMID